MSLVYDRDTAIYRNDLQYYDDIETKQQDLGLTANSTERATNRFSFSDLASTYTVTQNIILTIISISATSAAAGAIGSLSAKINGLSVAQVNSRLGSVSKVINVPSWILKEGDELSFSNGSIGAAEVRGEFIGYFA